jgi:hypothetical protein
VLEGVHLIFNLLGVISVSMISTSSLDLRGKLGRHIAPMWFQLVIFRRGIDEFRVLIWVSMGVVLVVTPAIVLIPLVLGGKWPSSVQFFLAVARNIKRPRAGNWSSRAREPTGSAGMREASNDH